MFDLLQYLYYVISFANFWQLTNSVFNDYNSHMTASRVSKSRMLGFFFLCSLSLSTKVKNMMGPGFVFVDQQRTDQATVVDVLAHRMGVPDHTNLRLDQNLTRENLQ